MPIALIVGEYDKSDLIIGAFRDTAFGLGYDIKELGYQAAMDKLPDPREQHLVLFCVPKGLPDPAERLRSLRPCGKRTIAYVHTSRASVDEAIRYCHEGLADGYLVNGDSRSVKGICELVVKFNRGEPPHTKIEFDWHACKTKPTAFISTPFDHDNRAVMKAAVDLALDKLGFAVEWGDRNYCLTIHDNIRETILRSAILIANISLDERYQDHNPNVYYEAGIAASKKGRPIVFVRRTEQNNVLLPADIHGRRWLTYDNEIELAQKLYHGLKPDAC